jgi:uncharacterized protein
LARAADLFDVRLVISYPSSRFGEARTVTVGLLDGEIVAIVWTDRNQAIRLISLRRARDAEKGTYHARYG